MNRNVEDRFAMNPTNIDISRSRFDRSHSVKTTFNVGDIIPFYVEEILPGDTFNVKSSKVVRMQTLLTPMMDNIYLDTYYFFVPNRLTWEHWKEFNGENTSSAWLPQVSYSVPQLEAPSSTGWTEGTIADYMGIPTGVAELSVNALPFRAYALICNDWFRDENLCDPLNIPLSDATVTGVNSGTFITDVAKGGLPYKAAKYHDYFTSCLPAPQKGPDVEIPISGFTQGLFPVYAVKDQWVDYANLPTGKTGSSVRWGNASGQFATSKYLYNGDPSIALSSAYFGDSNTSTQAARPYNLWSDVDFSDVGATINQLRIAFQIQKAYEKDARGGTRYIEILKAHFGVTSPDARQQRPEYLGGNRIPISINQVIQQSETASTPQGTVSGMSLTTDYNDDFIKSFTEHGFIIGVMVARYNHTYQQGLERFWSRKNRFDYYWPVFANIGEMAVKNKEIYAQGPAAIDSDTGVAYDEEVFGYQEAWADYRYKPSHVTGEMRSNYATSLDVWHLADDYNALPSLSDSWIAEDPGTVDRVLAVTSAVSDQLFADIFIKATATRPMPLYSIPGLIDHH